MYLKTVCLCLAAMLVCALPAWASFEEVEDKDLKAKVAEALKGQLKDFRLVNLKVAEVAKGLDGGRAAIPIMTQKGELMAAVYEAKRISLRAPGHNGMADLLSGKSDDPDIKEVSMPAEQIYQLGNCTSMKKGDPSAACGNLTILDPSQTMAIFMSIDPTHGMSIAEPINHLLGTTKYEGIHIVYNHAYTIPFDLLCEEVESTSSDHADAAFNISYIEKKTGLVLACDGQFYGWDQSTAWARLDAIWASVGTVYGLFQITQNENWRLRFEILRHRGFLPGFGPTTTDKAALSREVKNLPMPPEFTSDDLHHFIVGYDVSGVMGRACGIGSVRRGIGGGGGNNHAYSEAFRHWTHFATFIVAAHEAGHLLGGKHGDGSGSICIFPSFCGPSIMLDGAGGLPDTRVPVFSTATSASMAAVIERHLPDGP
jgi:hypothetical protein